MPAAKLERVVGLVVDVDVPQCLGQHLAGEVGDGHPHVVVTDVYPDHTAGSGVEGEQGGWPAAR